MSLATRCDACGTIFRVVQDQLKVSDGWVRCGRCHTVFDAQRGLFDLDRESPPAWTPPGQPEPLAEATDPESAAAAFDTEARSDAESAGLDDRSDSSDEFGTPTAAVQVDPVPEPDLANLIVDDAPWPEDPQPVAREVDWSLLRADSPPAEMGQVIEPVDATPADTVSEAPLLFVADPGAFIPNESRSSSLGRLAGDTPSDRVDPADRNDFADAQFPPSMLQDDGRNEDLSHITTEFDAPPLKEERSPAAPPAEPVEQPSSAAPKPRVADDAATPEFVRRARRIERWQSTESRVALSFVAVVAALALAWQTVHQFRQHILAKWPESTPLMARYCAVVGCSVQALRRIDAVSIETTSLTQGDAGSGSLRLSVTLRNRAELPVAMPSVDLSLTGADGELVARRALFPADFRTANLPLKPGVDTSLLLNFSVTERKVSGYTVEVFYP